MNYQNCFKVFVVVFLLGLVLAGCRFDDSLHTKAGISSYELRKAEDGNVVCYRFEAHEGIFCFNKKDLN